MEDSVLILDWEDWADRERGMTDLGRKVYAEHREPGHKWEPIYGHTQAAHDGIERECTLADLAVELGISLEMVRRIEQGALRKLRANPRAAELFLLMKGD